MSRAPKIDVIGYQVLVRTATKDKHGNPGETNRPSGRRYHVKDAAEQLAALLREEGHDAFVQEVMGLAEASPPALRRGRRAA